MSGEKDDPRSTDDISGASVDFDRLNAVAERFAADDRFTRIDVQPEFAPDRIACHYNPGFYPRRVAGARLEVVWFENGDFSLHYHEEHEDGAFDHRWDRHPSDHILSDRSSDTFRRATAPAEIIKRSVRQYNTRDHVHPGPDAPTPGDDASHPGDWRGVLSMVLGEIETRQRAFWTE